MTTTTIDTPQTSRARLWTARTLGGLATLFMLFDSIFKLFQPPAVTESMLVLGYPVDLAVPIGALALACTLLYAYPRTTFLGAVLLTGYLGGAVATHLRVGNPLFSHILFPTYIGLLLWLPLFLMDRRVRTLLQLRRA